jgi:hypothetical protein
MIRPADGEFDGADDVDSEPRRLGGDPKSCPVCGVRLSSYNPGPNCWQHTIGQPWRGPSAKPRY